MGPPESRPRRPVVPAVKDHGLSREKIGYPRMVDLGDGQAVPVHFEIGQVGVPDSLVDAPHRLGGRPVRGEISQGAAPELCPG